MSGSIMKMARNGCASSVFRSFCDVFFFESMFSLVIMSFFFCLSLLSEVTFFRKGMGDGGIVS